MVIELVGTGQGPILAQLAVIPGSRDGIDMSRQGGAPAEGCVTLTLEGGVASVFCVAVQSGVGLERDVADQAGVRG